MLGIVVLAVLAGCNAPPSKTNKFSLAVTNGGFVAGMQDPCGAAGLKDLVGQDSAALNRAALPDKTRVLYPHSEKGTRTNILRMTATVDANNIITSITCG
jgi:hypothetical protein